MRKSTCGNPLQSGLGSGMGKNGEPPERHNRLAISGTDEWRVGKYGNLNTAPEKPHTPHNTERRERGGGTSA